MFVTGFTWSFSVAVMFTRRWGRVVRPGTSTLRDRYGEGTPSWHQGQCCGSLRGWTHWYPLYWWLQGQNQGEKSESRMQFLRAVFMKMQSIKLLKAENIAWIWNDLIILIFVVGLDILDILRIKNYWCIHSLVCFKAFQTRYPTKPELSITMESFNGHFQAAYIVICLFKGSSRLSPYHTLPTALASRALRSEQMKMKHLGFSMGCLVRCCNSIGSLGIAKTLGSYSCFKGVKGMFSVSANL